MPYFCQTFLSERFEPVNIIVYNSMVGDSPAIYCIRR